MAFREAVSNIFHAIGDVVSKPISTGSGERGIMLAMPVTDYTPVNEPSGTPGRMVKNAFYRLIGSDNRDKGLMFLCRCGVSNPFLFGNYNLRRELEQDHHCCANCVSIIEKRSKDGELEKVEQVRHTRTDEKGNVFPVGAPFNLRDCLPDRGEGLSEAERDKCYATLPTWRLQPDRTGAPFMSTWDDSQKDVYGWDGDKASAARADINNGLW